MNPMLRLLGLSIFMLFCSPLGFAQTANPNNATSVAPIQTPQTLVNCCYNTFVYQTYTQGTCPSNSFVTYSELHLPTHIWYDCVSPYTTCQYLTVADCNAKIASQPSQGASP